MPEPEVKPTPETPPITPTPPEPKKDMISIDIDGVSIEVPIEIGKKLVDARQKSKKEVKDLVEKVSKAEATAKAELDRNSLLKAMRDSDIESVKTQVSQEYLDKISKYENKIFKSEIKGLMASQGVLASALDDAVNLALQNAKLTLDGDEIKVNDKLAKDAVEEFIKSRPHLVSVKATPGKPQVGVKGSTPKPPQPSSAEKLKSGLTSFLKPK